MSEPIQCVGIICFRANQVLLIKRAVPPRQGEWSIPGGRIEKGESEQEACLRELMEETAISAKLGPKIEMVEARFGNTIYHLHDYVAEWISGDPIPNNEVLETRFFSMTEMAELGMWPKTVEIIERGFALIQ